MLFEVSLHIWGGWAVRREGVMMKDRDLEEDRAPKGDGFDVDETPA